MNNKVAVNKKEIDKLIKDKKYDEAKEYINNVRKIIKITTSKRIKNNRIKILLDKDKLYSFMEMSVNNKLLEDEDYILVDECYIDKVIKDEKVKKIHKRRNCYVK